MKFLAILFFVAICSKLALSGSVPVVPPVDTKEEVVSEERLNFIRSCVPQKWDVLSQKCGFLTPVVQDAFTSCVKELQVTPPCVVSRLVEGKVFHDCPEGDMNSTLSQTFVSSCWESCVIKKLDVLVPGQELLDVSKTSKLLHSVQVLKSTPLDVIKKNVLNFNEALQKSIAASEIPADHPCGVVSIDFQFLVDAVQAHLGVCVEEECKKIMN